MKQVVLETKKRESQGKGSAKKIRKTGFVPAVLYGKGTDPVNIEVPEKDFSKGLSKYGMNALFNIKVGADSYTTMISEIQKAPLTKQIFHVDFHKIALDSMITTEVPVRLEGESRGVRAGGVLEHTLWNLEIEVLPLEIPEAIVIDVTSLDLDSEIRVKDLTLPKGVTSLSAPDLVVVAVKSQREESEEADLFAEPSAEPEVIKKGKEDKED